LRDGIPVVMLRHEGANLLFAELGTLLAVLVVGIWRW
jgi:hypothetical protein